MSKIKRIAVKNLKALSEKEITFDGCTAIITAGNDKGKTSFIRSLMDRMRGIKPDRILKQGKVGGSYEMELTTGEKFVWTFNDKGTEKMVFVTEKDIKTSLTKDICKFYFPDIFNVDEFLEMQPAKQKTTLEKIAGIDFTELNKSLKASTEDRTYQSRLVAETQARLETVNTHLPEKIDESFLKLNQELNNIAVNNEKIKGVASKVVDKKKILNQNKEEIVALQAKIKLYEDANMQLETEIDKGNNWLKEDKNKIKTPEQIKVLQTQVDKIKDENKLIEENNKAKEKEKEHQLAVKNYDKADADVKKFQNDKLDAIKNAANLPAGFGFTDDGITYNGLAYDRATQSSTAIYIGALKLAAIGLGEVKTLYFDAAPLDRPNLAKIEAWANEQGLQLLIEIPDQEGGEIEYQLIQEKV